MSEWFKHDSAATRDPKLVHLRVKMGYEGIGMFWTLIEHLAIIDSHDWPVDSLDELADLLRFDSSKFKQMLEVCQANACSLLGIESSKLFSRGLKTRLGASDDIREKRKEAGRRGGQKRAENANSQANVKQVLEKSQAEQNRVEQKEEREARGRDPEPAAAPEPLGKSAEQIIANHDGQRTLSFEEILTVIEGQRDPDKRRNVTFNERGHLHKIYHLDGLAEKLSIAVLKLSKTAWRGTLEQIEEVMQGKEPRSKHKTEHNTPQVPKAKPAKRAKNEGMTFEEAMKMTNPNSPLPF